MLISRYQEIEKLRRTKITSRAAKAVSVAKVGNCIVIRLPGDRWWCNYDRFDKGAFLPGNFNGWVGELLTGLVKVGLLEQKLVDAHKAECDRADRIRQYHQDKNDLAKLAKKYGCTAPEITMPKVGEPR